MPIPGLKAVADVRREELPFALAMSTLFFLVITSFWILKPLKKAIFVQFYDRTGFELMGWSMDAAQAELIAKVLNMVVAIVAAIAFGLVARRLTRWRLGIAAIAFFVAGDLAFMPLLGDPRAPAVWAFYLYGDLFATVMVAAFFAFLNDSVSPGAARRLYGLVGLGGVTGGVVGSSTLTALIDTLGPGELLWICVGLGVLVAGVSWSADRLGRSLPAESLPRREAGVPEPDGSGDGVKSALRGAQLVARSRYLLAIVAIVGLYEIASTVMDFQFTSAVAHWLDGDRIGEHFSLVYAITNGVSMFVQLFLTGFVMSRLGVGVALLVLPATILASSGAFLLAPSLWVGSMLNTADNAFNYSINQSAKEALYVPTSREEKYEAKAFIDMFVQRFAKAMAVVVSLGITAWFERYATVRWLSLFTIAILLVWVPAARYAGRRFGSEED